MKQKLWLTRGNIITWELAQEYYGVGKYFLERLSILNPNICDKEQSLVYNLWNNNLPDRVRS